VTGLIIWFPAAHLFVPDLLVSLIAMMIVGKSEAIFCLSICGVENAGQVAPHDFITTTSDFEFRFKAANDIEKDR
jgi:hypothetical protein